MSPFPAGDPGSCRESSDKDFAPRDFMEWLRRERPGTGILHRDLAPEQRPRPGQGAGGSPGVWDVQGVFLGLLGSDYSCRVFPSGNLGILLSSLAVSGEIIPEFPPGQELRAHPSPRPHKIMEWPCRKQGMSLEWEQVPRKPPGCSSPTRGSVPEPGNAPKGSFPCGGLGWSRKSQPRAPPGSKGSTNKGGL